MTLSGESLLDEKITNSINLLEETFDDDASLGKGIYFWKLGLSSYENEPLLQIRMYNRKFSSANGSTMKFQTLITTPVVVGDVIFDSVNKGYWICTESFNIDNIHFQGKLTQCNWILKWQLIDGTIVEYPCQDMNATQYNSGETSNKQFTIGSSQHMLTLPCDDNTVVLNSPMRFYLDKNMIKPTTYIITQNDTTSYNYGKGLCKITVQKCVENNDKDRPDLRLCNYKEVSNDAVETSSKIIYDTNIIKSGGDIKTFKAVFYNEFGEVVDILPKWDIACDFKKNLNVMESNGEIKIGIDDDKFIDEEFLLILTDVNGDNYSSLIIQIDSLL